MARPSNRSPRKSPLSFMVPQGMTTKEIKFEPAENAKEREHRLRKDWWSFVVNDLVASVIAYVVLMAVVVFSFWTLAKSSASPDDKKFATSMLAAVLAAVAGFVFGKGKN